MSNATKQRTEGTTESDKSILSYAKQWYHVPVLAAVMVFMLATRMQALSNFQTPDGITFRGNDPWWHYRESNYVLENFPATMPFDPWTNYPFGTEVGQFGTLFDQIVVGFVLLTSFGDPSPEYFGLIMLSAAPVFAVAAVIPAYVIAAKFAGRGPALAGMVGACTVPWYVSQLRAGWIL